MYVDDIVWCRRVNFFLLERIVIGVLFEERYLWVKSVLVVFFCESFLNGFINVWENGKLNFFYD